MSIIIYVMYVYFLRNESYAFIVRILHLKRIQHRGNVNNVDILK